jgi:hypothetical protein
MCLLGAAICSSCKTNTLFQIFTIRKSQGSQKGLKLIELFHAFVYSDDINSSGKDKNNIKKNTEMILQANNRWSGDEKEPHV